MSTNASNLFAFDRALPSPFDTLKSKRLSVSSKYGDGTASTLCASVIKGIHAVFRCMDGGEGAVGVIDHRTVAEYKSSMGPDTYHQGHRGSGDLYGSQDRPRRRRDHDGPLPCSHNG